MSWGFGAAGTTVVYLCTTTVVCLRRMQRGCSADLIPPSWGSCEHLTLCSLFRRCRCVSDQSDSSLNERCGELPQQLAVQVSSSALEIVRHAACSADRKLA